MPTWAFFCSEPECGPGPELEYQTLRLWPHRVHGPRLSVPQKCAEHLQHQQVWITLNMTLVWLDHGLWQYHFLIWFCDSICALHSPRKERISPRRIMVDRLATWLQRLPSDAFPLPSCSIFQCKFLLRLGTLFCSFWFTDCWNPIHVCIENTAWNLYFILVPEYRTSIAKYTEHKDTKCRVHHGSGMLAAFVLHFFDYRCDQPIMHSYHLQAEGFEVSACIVMEVDLVAHFQAVDDLPDSDPSSFSPNFSDLMEILV